MRTDTATAPCTIRPLAASDYARWFELWRAYQAFYAVDLPPAVSETTWQRFHDPADPVYALGAEIDGALVGLTHFLFHRSTWLQTDTCYLQDLYVDPAVRGRGVGRALIEAVYGQADTRSDGRVYWLTHQDNRTARQLYDALAVHAGFLAYRRPAVGSYDD